MAVITQHCELPNTTQWCALKCLILLSEFHLNAKGKKITVIMESRNRHTTASTEALGCAKHVLSASLFNPHTNPGLPRWLRC